MAVGLKLWKLKDGELYSCDPSRDFSPWSADSHIHKCSRFHEIFNTGEKCTCGSSAWTSLEAFLCFLCITIEKTLVAYQPSNFHYNLIAGIVEGEEVQRNLYGWKSKDVSIKKIIPISWKPVEHPHSQISLSPTAINIGFNASYNFAYKTKSHKNCQRFLASSTSELQKIINQMTPKQFEINALQIKFEKKNLDTSKLLFDLAEEIIQTQPKETLRSGNQELFSRTHIRRFCKMRDSLANSLSAASFPSPRYLHEDLRCSQPSLPNKKIFGKKNYFSQGALGFRAWEINWHPGYPYPKLLSLTSAGGRKSLSSGIQTAGCIICKNPPHKKHHCGFNAFSCLEELFISEYLEDASMPSMTWNKKQIIGSVAGFGKTRIHNDTGWRSERMALVALLLPKGIHPYNTYYQQAKQISEYYRVPLFQDRRIFEEYSLTQASCDYLKKQPVLGADCFD